MIKTLGKSFARKATCAVSAGVIAITGIVAFGVPAASAAPNCYSVTTSLGVSSGRLQGFTQGSCYTNSIPQYTTVYRNIRLRVAHVYNNLPDATVYEFEQQRAVTQQAPTYQLGGNSCDNGTTADYYAYGTEVFSATATRSANRRVTTC